MTDRDARMQRLRSAIESLGYGIDLINKDIVYAQRQIEAWEAQIGLVIEEQHILNTELHELLKEDNHD